MIKRKIEVECEKNVQIEMCGFVVEKDGEFDVVPMKNRSPNPKEEFYIPAKEFLYVKTNNKIVAVYHSHTRGGCEPSDFDIKTAEMICYPFVMYSLERNTFGVHRPEYSDADETSVQKLEKALK